MKKKFSKVKNFALLCAKARNNKKKLILKKLLKLMNLPKFYTHETVKFIYVNFIVVPKKTKMNIFIMNY